MPLDLLLNWGPLAVIVIMLAGGLVSLAFLIVLITSLRHLSKLRDISESLKLIEVQLRERK